MNKVVSIFAILYIASTANSAYLGKNKNGIDMFTINLDAPPQDRFKEPA